MIYAGESPGGEAKRQLEARNTPRGGGGGSTQVQGVRKGPPIYLFVGRKSATRNARTCRKAYSMAARRKRLPLRAEMLQEPLLRIGRPNSWL